MNQRIRPALAGPLHLSLLLALLPSAGLADTDGVSIGYPSVRAAANAVTTSPHAAVREESGWTVVTDTSSGHKTVWSFASPAHPAYPVAVRRDFVMKSGLPTLVTRYTCEGARGPCEQLYSDLRRSGREAPGTSGDAVPD